MAVQATKFYHGKFAIKELLAMVLNLTVYVHMQEIIHQYKPIVSRSRCLISTNFKAAITLNESKENTLKKVCY